MRHTTDTAAIFSAGQRAANRDTLPETLTATVHSALTMIGDGAPRSDGERAVPLGVWRTAQFTTWYAAQRGAGNVLSDARVLWAHHIGDPARLFAWALANLQIADLR